MDLALVRVRIQRNFADNGFQKCRWFYRVPEDRRQQGVPSPRWGPNVPHWFLERGLEFSLRRLDAVDVFADDSKSFGLRFNLAPLPSGRSSRCSARQSSSRIHRRYGFAIVAHYSASRLVVTRRQRQSPSISVPSNCSRMGQFPGSPRQRESSNASSASIV